MPETLSWISNVCDADCRHSWLAERSTLQEAVEDYATLQAAIDSHNVRKAAGQGD